MDEMSDVEPRASQGKGILPGQIPTIVEYATKRELAAVKGRITKLHRTIKDQIAKSDTYWGRQVGRIHSEIEQLLEGSDAPDPTEAFNEVAGCLEAQVVELRSALAQLAIAAVETRKIADKCAELMGVQV